MAPQTFEHRPLPATDQWPFAPPPAARDGRLRDNLVTADELHDLLTHGGREALAVIDRAREATRELYGNRRTYVVNRNINFTDICEYHCTFCGYKTAVGDPHGRTQSVAEIIESLAGSVPGMEEDRPSRHSHQERRSEPGRNRPGHLVLPCQYSGLGRHRL